MSDPESRDASDGAEETAPAVAAGAEAAVPTPDSVSAAQPAGDPPESSDSVEAGEVTDPEPVKAKRPTIGEQAQRLVEAQIVGSNDTAMTMVREFFRNTRGWDDERIERFVTPGRQANSALIAYIDGEIDPASAPSDLGDGDAGGDNGAADPWDPNADPFVPHPDFQDLDRNQYRLMTFIGQAQQAYMTAFSHGLIKLDKDDADTPLPYDQWRKSEHDLIAALKEAQLELTLEILGQGRQQLVPDDVLFRQGQEEGKDIPYMGDEQLEILIDQLDAPDRGVQRRALEALRRCWIFYVSRRLSKDPGPADQLARNFDFGTNRRETHQFRDVKHDNKLTSLGERLRRVQGAGDPPQGGDPASQQTSASGSGQQPLSGQQSGSTDGGTPPPADPPTAAPPDDPGAPWWVGLSGALQHAEMADWMAQPGNRAASPADFHAYMAKLNDDQGHEVYLKNLAAKHAASAAA